MACTQKRDYLVKMFSFGIGGPTNEVHSFTKCGETDLSRGCTSNFKCVLPGGGPDKWLGIEIACYLPPEPNYAKSLILNF